MFTVEQIKHAHGKVKSGADFPAYIKELKALGVTHYQTYVSDGHTDYYGADEYKTSSPAKSDTLSVANACQTELFRADLKAHQQGQTDYLSFCNSCAKYGIEKWEVCMDKMTCTYFDRAGKEILVEEIPQ